MKSFFKLLVAIIAICIIIYAIFLAREGIDIVNKVHEGKRSNGTIYDVKNKLQELSDISVPVYFLTIGSTINSCYFELVGWDQSFNIRIPYEDGKNKNNINSIKSLLEVDKDCIDTIYNEDYITWITIPLSSDLDGSTKKLTDILRKIYKVKNEDVLLFHLWHL